MSLRGLAGRFGVAPAVVQRAVRSGRLAGSVGRDASGAPFIADAELAAQEWTTRRCLACGHAFEVAARAKGRRYCSPGCRPSSIPKARVIGRAATCGACGVEFLAGGQRGKRRYCSKPCSMRAFWSSPAGHRRRAKLADAYRAARPLPATQACPECGADFAPQRKNASQCRPCRDRAALRPSTDPAPRPCAWCRQEFVPRRRSASRQEFCSRAHKAIFKSKRRKARLRGAAVGEPPSLWAIYERDGGRCGLCGDGVERTLRWPDKRCASLDHIIPISRGGTDGSGNVQLAHLGCNIEKSNRLPGETKRPRRAA